MPTTERKEYLLIEEILNELRSWLQYNTQEVDKLNCITLSGSGEPALNINIDQLIIQIKKITTIPVAVITNASLLNDSSVRRALLEADIIIPSLNAACASVFQNINRPKDGIAIEDIIKGLVDLRKEFGGKIWLEVMLVKGINDDLGHIRELKEALDNINPDKIQLNSPVRITAESNVFAVDKKRLTKIKEILGDKCEVI